LTKNNLSYLLFLVAVISSFCLGWIVHIPETLIISDTKIETVEVPVIIENTVTVVETVEIPYPIFVNNTKVIEYERLIPIPLRDFPDQKTLQSFIDVDDTDSFSYEDRWTCMDYTVRVIKNAERLGYRVLFVFREDQNHAICMAYCEDEALYYVWETQSDSMLWTWQSTEAG